MRRRSEAPSGGYGRCDYRWVADWQSVQSGLITCWNIGIDRDEDSELIDLYNVEGKTFSLHTTRLRDSPRGEDGRLSPEPVLRD